MATHKIDKEFEGEKRLIKYKLKVAAMKKIRKKFQQNWEQGFVEGKKEEVKGNKSPPKSNLMTIFEIEQPSKPNEYPQKQNY